MSEKLLLPLTEHRKAQLEIQAYKAYQKIYTAKNPEPQFDVGNLRSNTAGANLIYWFIRNINVLQIAALFFFLILAFDKTVAVFSRTSLFLPSEIVGVSAYIAITAALVSTAFMGGLQVIRNRIEEKVTLISLCKSLLAFIGIIKYEHKAPMAQFSMVIMLTEMIAGGSAVLLKMVHIEEGFTPENIFNGIISLMVAFIIPYGLHSFGHFIAVDGNEVLETKIQEKAQTYIDAYNQRFQESWLQVWREKAPQAHHEAYLKLNKLPENAESPYLMLMTGDETQPELVAVPLASPENGSGGVSKNS